MHGQSAATTPCSRRLTPPATWSSGPPLRGRQCAQPATRTGGTRDKDNVAWAILDRPGSSANTLNARGAGGAGRHPRRASSRTGPKALVIRSGKPGGFVVRRRHQPVRET